MEVEWKDDTVDDVYQLEDQIRWTTFALFPARPCRGRDADGLRGFALRQVVALAKLLKEFPGVAAVCRVAHAASIPMALLEAQHYLTPFVKYTIGKN